MIYQPRFTKYYVNGYQLSINGMNYLSVFTYQLGTIGYYLLLFDTIFNQLLNVPAK